MLGSLGGGGLVVLERLSGQISWMAFGDEQGASVHSQGHREEEGSSSSPILETITVWEYSWRFAHGMVTVVRLSVRP